MRDFFDFFWPTLDRLSADAQKLDEENFQREIAEITDANWGGVSESVLVEVRQLYEEEEERRRIADSKATAYLLFAAALLPVLTYFEGVIWGDKIGSAPRPIAFSILVVALMYVLGFGYWAFKTMRLVGYYRIGTNEIIGLVFRRAAGHGPFIRKYLEYTRRNQKLNNDRLSCLKMAHLFLYRVFIAFSAAIILESGYGVYDAFVPKKSALPRGQDTEQPAIQPNTDFDRSHLLKVKSSPNGVFR